MKQSRLQSLFETTLSTAIGFAVALLTQIFVFPLFGFNPPLHDNLIITAIFTVVSVLRGMGVRRLFEALHIRIPISPFMAAVVAERQRQKDGEGWSEAHDDKHPDGELARAGACYARNAGSPDDLKAPDGWPWRKRWWKPAGFRRDLVKGAALIIAEGEKFDRCRRPKPQPAPPKAPHNYDDQTEYFPWLRRASGES